METTLDVDQRQNRAKLLTGREVRQVGTVEMETRDPGDGLLHFRGVASSTETPYDMGWYAETVRAGAFAKTLREKPDVQLLANHVGLPLARTTNGSLKIEETERGLEFDGHADAEDTDAISLHRKVKSGLMDQCSFAFRTIRESWNEDYDQRSLDELSLNRGDVSICNYGANPNTPVVARNAEAIHGMTVREVADYLMELRAGAALSTGAMAVLKHVLSLASTSDTAVDELQVVLSEFMGVPNPDTEQDPSMQSNAIDLSTFQMRARALKL